MPRQRFPQQGKRGKLTFAQYIESEIGKQPIKGCVIGPFGFSDSKGQDDDKISYYRKHDPERKYIPPALKKKLMRWEQAREWLDYPFANEWGVPDVHAVYLWTQERVYFVVNYDGKITLTSVPRYQTDCSPTLKGLLPSARKIRSGRANPDDFDNYQR